VEAESLNDQQSVGPTDATTTIAELRQVVRQFVDERHWNHFHAPKNLVMALAIEAAELMEHFQWQSVEQSRLARDDAEHLAAIADELADVTCYALALANTLNIDLSLAVRQKMVKNAVKYPVEKNP
jgi:dCTP diphosphatase